MQIKYKFLTPSSQPSSQPSSKPTQKTFKEQPSRPIDLVTITISGSFQLSSSSDLTPLLSSGCSNYCLSLKQAIAQAMSPNSDLVNPNSIEINTRSSRRLLDTTRRLSSTVTVDFTTTVYTTATVASAATSNLEASFQSGQFVQVLSTFATSNGATSLQNVQVSSLVVTSKVDSQQEGNTSSSILSSSSKIGIAVAAVVVLTISYTMYYYSTRNTLTIKNLPEDITDIRKEIPGVVTVIPRSSVSDVAVVLDSHRQALFAKTVLELRGDSIGYQSSLLLLLSLS